MPTQGARFDERLAAVAAVAAVMAVTAVLATVLGTFYDDEIANLQIVSNRDFSRVIHIANTVDVHPPGSYLLNKLLHDLLGSWSAVKLAGGLCNAVGYATFLWFGYGKLNAGQRRWLTFLLATAASAVLWGASLRWYAYFNPIFAAALAIILFSDWRLTTRSIVLAIASVALFYLSYAAFCAVPALLAAHVGREFGHLRRRDISILVIAGALALLACSPQLVVFANVHAAHESSQTGAPLQAAMQMGMTLLLGNAVFPVAALPLIYAFAVILIVGWYLLRESPSRLDRVVLATLLVGTVCMVATGLAVKPRNSVFLLPLMALLLAAALAQLPSWPRVAAAALVIVYQATGIWNVAAHEDTTKGSYNTDFNAVMADVHAWRKRCGALVVINHDPVLSYLLQEEQTLQSSPYSAGTASQVALAAGDCVIAVKTYRGILSPASITQLESILTSGTLRPVAAHDFGVDSHRAAKRWILHDEFPEFYVHDELWQVQRPVSLTLVSGPSDDPAAGASGS